MWKFHWPFWDIENPTRIYVQAGRITQSTLLRFKFWGIKTCMFLYSHITLKWNVFSKCLTLSKAAVSFERKCCHWFKEWLPNVHLPFKTKYKYLLFFVCCQCGKIKMLFFFLCWQCDQCNAPFSTIYNLKMHRKRHERTELFVCDVKDCNLSFPTMIKLKNHLRIHFPERRIK